MNGRGVQDTPLTSRTVEHGYTPLSLSNGAIDFDTPPTTIPLLNSQPGNLSNSASTLIERSTSPSSDGTLHKRSSESLLANGGTPSDGSGALRLSLKTDTTLAASTAYAIGNGTSPGSIPSIGMDWNHPKQLLSSIHDPPPPQGLNLKLPPMACLLYTSPSPRDATLSRMPSSA